jgi:hypothetical protein
MATQDGPRPRRGNFHELVPPRLDAGQGCGGRGGKAPIAFLLNQAPSGGEGA